MTQVLSMNPDIDPDKVKEGQTILLPAGKLSSRDKEILEGIGHVYRVYPVRKVRAVSMLCYLGEAWCLPFIHVC
jgi:hypothetical protein